MSLWSIIAANFIVIALSQWREWSLASLIWTYWCQSLITGLFWFFRMLELKDFHAESWMMEGDLKKLAEKCMLTRESPMDTAFRAKAQLAAGQLFLFITIHVTLLLRIRSLIPESETWDFRNVAIGASLFFVSQCIAYPKSNRWIAGRRPTAAFIIIPNIALAPIYIYIYMAIWAMAQYATTDTVLLFLGAKTVADVTMHAVQYSCFGDSAYTEKTFLDYEPTAAGLDSDPDTEECEFCSRTIHDSETPYCSVKIKYSGYRVVSNG